MNCDPRDGPAHGQGKGNHRERERRAAEHQRLAEPRKASPRSGVPSPQAEGLPLLEPPGAVAPEARG